MQEADFTILKQVISSASGPFGGIALGSKKSLSRGVLLFGPWHDSITTSSINIRAQNQPSRKKEHSATNYLPLHSFPGLNVFSLPCRFCLIVYYEVSFTAPSAGDKCWSRSSCKRVDYLISLDSRIHGAWPEEPSKPLEFSPSRFCISLIFGCRRSGTLQLDINMRFYLSCLLQQTVLISHLYPLFPRSISELVGIR